MSTVYLEPLLLTVIFEAAGAYALGIRDLKRQYLILLVNCITNPVLVTCSLILMKCAGIRTGMIMTYAILEPLVVICEYAMYKKKMSASIHPMILSLVLNVLSIMGGVLWRSLF